MESGFNATATDFRRWRWKQEAETAERAPEVQPPHQRPEQAGRGTGIASQGARPKKAPCGDDRVLRWWRRWSKRRSRIPHGRRPIRHKAHHDGARSRRRVVQQQSERPPSAMQVGAGLFILVMY